MNTDYFARQKMILSPEASNMIKNVRILVVGAGAGGNEVLKNLLLMGFGNITIIDFDHVEDSNLSRTTLFRKEDIGKSKALVAAERLTEMALHESPNIRGIHGNLMTDIGKHIFWEHDIVISCVDTQKARAYINDWCVQSNTPFFEMGFSGYDVNISFFTPIGDMIQRDGTSINSLPSKDGFFPILKGEFPVCLRELIGVGDFEEKRNSCSTYKVRDVNLSKIPTIQVSAAMAGVLVATELIKYLDGKNTLCNQMLSFYGRICKMEIFGFNRNKECFIHDKKINEITSIEVCPDTTVKEFLENIKTIFHADDVILHFDGPYIISCRCHCCGKIMVYNKHHSQFWDDERWCDDCKKAHSDYMDILTYSNETVSVPQEISLEASEEVLNHRLSEIGVPSNDIITVFVITSGVSEQHFIRNCEK